MRITPLGVYCHKLTDPNEIYTLTKLDVNLTHGDKSCVQAVTCYNIAISYLLRNLGDADGAITTVNEYISTIDGCEDLKENWEKVMNAESESDLIPATKHIGFILIAFSYSFFYLKQNVSYDEALRKTLKLGGDTDTNAAIVCGLVGARWGSQGIPESYRNAVLNAEPKRPDFLKLDGEEKFYKMIDKLVEIAPDSDTVKKQFENKEKE